MRPAHVPTAPHLRQSLESRLETALRDSAARENALGEQVRAGLGGGRGGLALAQQDPERPRAHLRQATLHTPQVDALRRELGTSAHVATRLQAELGAARAQVRARPCPSAQLAVLLRQALAFWSRPVFHRLPAQRTLPPLPAPPAAHPTTVDPCTSAHHALRERLRSLPRTPKNTAGQRRGAQVRERGRGGGEPARHHLLAHRVQGAAAGGHDGAAWGVQVGGLWGLGLVVEEGGGAGGVASTGLVRARHCELKHWWVLGV